jgi:hypothetical protein
MAEIVAQVVQTVVEVAAPVTQTVAAGAVGVGAVGRAAPAALTETARVATEAFNALPSPADILPASPPGMESMTLVGELHAFMRSSTAHGTLEFLAFGRVTSVGGENAGNVFEDALSFLAKGSENATRVLDAVDKSNVRDALKNDPVFAANFMDEFGKHLQREKAAPQSKDEGEKAARMRQLVEASERSALEKEAAKEKVKEEELERLKREAAIQAIRQRMAAWRGSVMKDERLTQEARQITLQKINVLEQRLIVKESLKWGKMSLMKVVALVSVVLQEAAEQTIPVSEGRSS